MFEKKAAIGDSLLAFSQKPNAKRQLLFLDFLTKTISRRFKDEPGTCGG
jgi:hypothetical protein